ncbi:MAG: filamentous hemagglutinin N-terminal domain-containing protein [Cyanobacteria bacterium J06634_5]
MTYAKFPRWVQFGLIFFLSQLAIATGVSPLRAQISPDDTLGSENSTLINNDAIDRIGGGAARGANLFHSFQEFNINTGQQVYFNNPEGIDNILSRVTGNSLSDIDGLLGVDGGASLFLLNPNGITFGPNAELDISGSFTASTSGTINFSDGERFSAIPPQDQQLLTMSTPKGVQLNDQPQGNIINDGLLSIGNSRTLTLFGNLVLHSGGLTTPGGTIHILGNQVGLLDQAKVDVSSNVGNGRIFIGGDYQGARTLPTAQQTYVGPNTLVTAEATQAGDGGLIVVWADGSTQAYGTFLAHGGSQSGNGGLVETSGREFLDVTDINVDASAANGMSGDWILDPFNVTIQSNNNNGGTTLAPPFIVNAEDSIVDIADINAALSSGTDVTVTTGNSGSQEGNILVDSGELIFLNMGGSSNGRPPTAFQNNISKSGGGPTTLTLEAANDISLEGIIDATLSDSPLNIVIIADSDNSGRGNVYSLPFTLVRLQSNGGDINITGQNINLEGSEITAAVAGEFDFSDSLFPVYAGSGTHGNIKIIAEENVIIGAIENPTVNDDGGDIAIEARFGDVIGTSEIGTTTNGTGDAGDIKIMAGQAVNLPFLIDTFTAADGTGGNVVVRGTEVSVPTIRAGSDSGNSGNISLTSTAGNLNINGFLSTTNTGAGSSGNISLSAAAPLILSGSPGRQDGFISSINSAQLEEELGVAGVISVSAPAITLDNYSITNPEPGNNLANSGDIRLNTNSLSLINGASIDSESSSRRNAGNINIQPFANGQLLQLLVDRSSAISATTVGEGTGGTLIIEAPNSPLEIEGNGEITVSSSGAGAAGNININTPSVEINQTQLLASTTGLGNGGDVQLNTARILLDNNARLSASTSGVGDGGSVVVTTSEALSIQGNGQLTVEARGETSGLAGDLNISASTLTLRNLSELVATSESQQGGGNINISANDAILTNQGSFINAEATNLTGGNGGNVVINTGFFITLPNENNDIIANAVGGNGGRITLTANRIFGLTSQSGFSTAQLRDNISSDISASSEFGLEGEVSLNNLVIDPNQGLTELPEDPSDPANQIARGCGADAIASITSGNGTIDNGVASDQRPGEFIITGRGGQPLSPTDIADNNVLLDDLGPSVIRSEPSSIPTSLAPPLNEPVTPETGAFADSQHAVRTPSGEVLLVASGGGQPLLSCSALR